MSVTSAEVTRQKWVVNIFTTHLIKAEGLVLCFLAFFIATFVSLLVRSRHELL